MPNCEPTDNEGEKTLKDEQPAPATEATNAPHLSNTTGQQTTKSTGSSSGREEDGHAETALVTTVPHCDANPKSVPAHALVNHVLGFCD